MHVTTARFANARPVVPGSGMASGVSREKVVLSAPVLIVRDGIVAVSPAFRTAGHRVTVMQQTIARVIRGFPTKLNQPTSLTRRAGTC